MSGTVIRRILLVLGVCALGYMLIGPMLKLALIIISVVVCAAAVWFIKSTFVSAASSGKVSDDDSLKPVTTSNWQGGVILLSKLPSWAREAISEVEDVKNHSSVAVMTRGDHHLAIVGTVFFFDNVRVVADGLENEPEPTIKLQSLPAKVRAEIANSSSRSTTAARIGEDSLVVYRGQVFFNSQRVVH